jgi:hypothetical protein
VSLSGHDLDVNKYFAKQKILRHERCAEGFSQPVRPTVAQEVVTGCDQFNDAILDSIDSRLCRGVSEADTRRSCRRPLLEVTTSRANWIRFRNVAKRGEEYSGWGASTSIRIAPHIPTSAPAAAPHKAKYPAIETICDGSK